MELGRSSLILCTIIASCSPSDDFSRRFFEQNERSAWIEKSKDLRIEEAYKLYDYKLHTRIPNDTSASIIVSSRGRTATLFPFNRYRLDSRGTTLIDTMPIINDLSKSHDYNVCNSNDLDYLINIARRQLNGRILNAYLGFLHESCPNKNYRITVRRPHSPT